MRCVETLLMIERLLIIMIWILFNFDVVSLSEFLKSYQIITYQVDCVNRDDFFMFSVVYKSKL